MSFLRPRAWVVALLFAVAVSLPFFSTATTQREIFFFEITLSSNSTGTVQLFYNVGPGFNEHDSVSQSLNSSAKPAVFRFNLPAGTIHGFRFDPINREGTVTFSDAKIVDKYGAVLQRFDPAQFRAANQIARVTPKNGGWEMQSVPGASDPNFEIMLHQPLRLKIGPKYWIRASLGAFFIAFFLVLALAALPVDRIAASRIGRIVPWAREHPVKALLGTAIVAVALQCHPVLFFGKSFVSPNNAVYLLYNTFPTVPGYHSTEVEDARGADVGAMMWAHLYCPVIAREAVFRHGELPLWNRYDLCGVPLLGQGQSMFGEPLNWLTIAANGATWAWDARFLLMRVLFAFGTGLCVWRLTRHLGAALLLTGSVIFIGFFAFRYNHAAILSVCWAPWVLVAWCELLEARTALARNLSLIGLVAAHGCMMTSGTIKEAYMLAACLDLAGFLLIVLAAATWRERLAKLGAAALAGLVFILLAAPQWMIFLDALKKSRTNYDVPAAAQLAPWYVIGFFDDLFYRQLRPDETHFDPSANFVILFGVLWALVTLRRNFTDRRFIAVLLATLLPLALVFGVIPASWIVRLPFIANIIHIDNTFSCPLLVLMAVLAGFGLAAFIRQIREPGSIFEYGFFVLLLGGLAALYFGSTQQLPKSAFFHGYAAALFLVLLICPVAAWFAVRKKVKGLLIAIVTGGLVVLLWRHGQYLVTPFDTYVMNPQVRVDLNASSPAIALVRAQTKEPSRPAGIGYNLFSGYNQMLGWESIYGVEAVRNSYIDELANLTPMKKMVDWVGGPIAQDDIKDALPMQDLMNVRHYLTTHQPTPRELNGRRWLASLDLDVYESPTAWPRAFFTNTLATYQEPADFVRLTLTGDHRPFAAVQAKDLSRLPDALNQLPKNKAARTVTPASNYRLTTNTTGFTVAATEPGIVVLTESYYPGDFQVMLNDERVDYFRVNHAFKGIYLPRPGVYHVTFRYWPERLTRALWLCLAGVCLGTAALVLDWRLRRPPPPVA